MKNRVVKINRLWNGLASIRDYIVEDAIKKNQSIVVKAKVDGKAEQMTISPRELVKNGFKAMGQKRLKSKFRDDQQYTLIDFRFTKDNKQMELFRG